jgi:hypothetical protein
MAGLPLWVVAASLLIPLAALPVVPTESAGSYMTALSALYSAVSALGAWFAVRELRQERLERNRPVIRIDTPASSSSALFFRVSNIGAGAAEEVSLRFDPEPIDFEGRPLSQISVFKNPTPVLMPNQEIRQLFQMGPNIGKPGVPSRFTVTASYRGQTGTYSETTVIDLGLFVDLTVPRPTEAESLARTVDAVQKVERALQQLPDRLAEAMQANSDEV